LAEGVVLGVVEGQEAEEFGRERRLDRRVEQAFLIPLLRLVAAGKEGVHVAARRCDSPCRRRPLSEYGA
jgi:hypothetical protein